MDLSSAHTHAMTLTHLLNESERCLAGRCPRHLRHHRVLLEYRQVLQVSIVATLYVSVCVCVLTWRFSDHSFSDPFRNQLLSFSLTQSFPQPVSVQLLYLHQLSFTCNGWSQSSRERERDSWRRVHLSHSTSKLDPNFPIWPQTHRITHYT